MLIVRDLCEGRRRFNGLLASLEGISSRTLSQRLKMLEGAGIVERERPGTSAQRVEYALTEKGRALLPLVEDLRRFGEEWLPRNPAANAKAPRKHRTRPPPNSRPTGEPDYP